MRNIRLTEVLKERDRDEKIVKIITDKMERLEVPEVASAAAGSGVADWSRD